MLWILIILALLFAFINGYRDSSSIVAGVVASRSLSPRKALFLVGLAELAAPFMFGVAVAKTITTGLIDPSAISVVAITSAVAASLLWTMVAQWRGIPSSSSHALVGGLIGAALMTGGTDTIIMGGLWKVILPLFAAPIAGLVAGYLTMQLILLLTRNATPKVNNLFQRLQIFTMVGLALSHSANDAQKSMGIIALGLLLEGRIDSFRIPPLVVALCAVSIALGAIRGDWKLMRTLGRKIYTIRPVDGLASQGASAGVVMVSAVLGAPVSTSQVVSMSLLGAGAAVRVNKVRWQVGWEMLLTWLVTLPATMLLAAAIVYGANSLESLIYLISR